MNLIGMFIAAEGKLLDPARSPSWIWPEKAELIYGTLASLIVFGALYKFAGPAIKKAMAARTEGIQNELDASAAAKAEAEAEAANIRKAAGDIDAERQRLFADADAQAELILTEGRARLEAEVTELQNRAASDVALSGSRAGDELRAEISRISLAATDQVLAGGLDAATQQDLIEAFISKVGAS